MAIDWKRAQYAPLWVQEPLWFAALPYVTRAAAALLLKVTEHGGIILVEHAMTSGSSDHASALAEVVGLRMGADRNDRTTMRAHFPRLFETGVLIAEGANVRHAMRRVPQKFERYRHLYLREEGTFAALRWFARAVAAQILKVCDDEGNIPLVRTAGRREGMTPALALTQELQFRAGVQRNERRTVESLLDVLFTDQYLALDESGAFVTVRNFRQAHPPRVSEVSNRHSAPAGPGLPSPVSLASLPSGLSPRHELTEGGVVPVSCGRHVGAVPASCGCHVGVVPVLLEGLSTRIHSTQPHAGARSGSPIPISQSGDPPNPPHGGRWFDLPNEALSAFSPTPESSAPPASTEEQASGRERAGSVEPKPSEAIAVVQAREAASNTHPRADSEASSSPPAKPPVRTTAQLSLFIEESPAPVVVVAPPSAVVMALPTAAAATPAATPEIRRPGDVVPIKPKKGRSYSSKANLPMAFQIKQLTQTLEEHGGTGYLPDPQGFYTPLIKPLTERIQEFTAHGFGMKELRLIADHLAKGAQRDPITANLLATKGKLHDLAVRALAWDSQGRPDLTQKPWSRPAVQRGAMPAVPAQNYEHAARECTVGATGDGAIALDPYAKNKRRKESP